MKLYKKVYSFKCFKEYLCHMQESRHWRCDRQTGRWVDEWTCGWIYGQNDRQMDDKRCDPYLSVYAVCTTKQYMYLLSWSVYRSEFSNLWFPQSLKYITMLPFFSILHSLSWPVNHFDLLKKKHHSHLMQINQTKVWENGTNSSPRKKQYTETLKPF